MNPELLEQITRLVVEKLQSQQSIETEVTEKNGGVQFWPHTEQKAKLENLSSLPISEAKTQELISIQPYITSVEKTTPPSRKTDDVPVEEINRVIKGLEEPADQEELEFLKSKTPARIGIGRAGLRPKTESWLKFRYDHAAAVDAVYGDVQEKLLKNLQLFKVHTQVTDKEVYIRRPDYGRKLSDEAKALIKEKCKHAPAVQIVVSDGLSSKAVDENVEDVYLSLQQALQSMGLEIGTSFFIEKGRVAVMDDIGELLRPKVVVLLIGERPGLVSAESLSAYLCYEPRKGTIEADRMVISNIHKGGIPPVEAGAYLGTVIQKILHYEASGVSLVQKEN
ncbi:ethanolamine ammonia-lyase subunit EutC [Sutcliffiella rhizosphaerae]|uniref:Ethanolamine ammonia-lyase small subunit n=1 Tax=Sutcliffiella rhizosphaerae TaxID=2880967 RepID=A0ABM8YK58_9BACI|nr:ethanolamine ammonia-lyase subunit EutC [Sutcliffiella rhizosphaerae]CAG9620309.1 Ethanolamine ammonia-lyase light chain [Sutcliffiella rhizosphaerae]